MTYPYVTYNKERDLGSKSLLPITISLICKLLFRLPYLT